LFLRTKDSPSAQKATEIFGEARDHLQRSASLLPERRVIIEVGLGAEETELTRMVKEVKALEERLAKMEEELRAVTAERDSLKRKLDEV
jgi:CII-binding regulator of phage lambda lysogenization HflD